MKSLFRIGQVALAECAGAVRSRLLHDGDDHDAREDGV